MKLTLSHSGAILLAIMLLQSCGGGSRDDSDDSANSCQANRTCGLIILDASNALDVGIQGFQLTADAFQVVSLLSEATLLLHQQSLVTQHFDCPGGGSITLSAEDRDGNETLNGGDRVTISYAACDGSTGGTLDVVFTLVQQDSGQIVSLHGNAAFNLNFPDQNQTTLTGTGFISHRIGASELFWQATNVTETLAIGGQEDFGRIDVEKTLTVPASRYSVGMSGTVDSDTFGGRYDFYTQTPTPYVGDEQHWPDGGRVLVHGRPDAVSIYQTHDAAQGIAFYEVYNGNVNLLQAQVDWSELSNGMLFGIPGDRRITPIPSAGVNLSGRRIELGASGDGLVADKQRGRIYVTVPDRHELLILSAQTLAPVRRIDLGSRLSGLSLSADGEEIFVGLDAAGSIAVIDADTYAVSSVFVATEPGDSEVHQIVETAPGVLLAAVGTAGVSGRIVRIDRASGAVTRVGSSGPNHGAIELLADRGRGLLFAADGLGVSIPTLYQYDANDPRTALVREKRNQSVDFANRLSLDPTGTHLYLSSGQVLAVSDFSQIGRITRGTPWASENGTDVMVGTGEGVLHVHSAADLHEIDRLVTDCALTRESGELVTDVDRLIQSPVDGQWLLLGGDILCAVDLNNPTVRPGTS